MYQKNFFIKIDNILEYQLQKKILNVKKTLSKKNTNDTAFFKAYKELENSELDIMTNNDRKISSSNNFLSYFSQKNSSEKTDLIKESPNKIPKYPNKAVEGIRNTNKKGSIQELNKNSNNSNQKQNQIISYQLSFNPKDQIKINSFNKEEKENNNNNNFENNSESENYSPIGKLVSFQNINSNNKNSNEKLDAENHNKNLNTNNANDAKNLNNKANQILENNNINNNNNNNKNILGLKNNFEAENESEYANDSSSEDENVEEEINEYRENSNENFCKKIIKLLIF